MTSIYSTSVFKWSVISSLLLFFSIMFGQYFWSKIWVLYAFIEIPIFIFFFAFLISSILYWAKNKRTVRGAFYPFIINITVLALVIILPLNFIRNWIKYQVYRNSFENSAQLAMKATTDNTGRFLLPADYQSLSINDGNVRVAHLGTTSAVMFFSFLGAPDGVSGFIKVSDGGDFDVVKSHLVGEIYSAKSLGNNWYYVAGN